jgi:tetratricopeptide (TPR) repeat protein
VTHDTDPADVAATALPMREVKYALDHTLKAERVVIFADTCHSAAMGNTGRRSEASNAAIMSGYLKQIGESRPGRAWLLSAEANESSFEHEKWGGGHGLFTHFLMEGLKGGADRDGKGLIKVGDLFNFIEERVQKESGNLQHPTKGVEGFDRNLVLAVTAHLDASEHYEIGCLLEHMGRLLNDSRRFESASRQLERAFRLAKDNGIAMPRAMVQNGLARLSARDATHALECFDLAIGSATECDPPDLAVIADARFHRVIALLDSDAIPESILAAIHEFLDQHPEDSRADCGKEMLQRIERPRCGRRRAVLIGVNEYPGLGLSFKGCVNDVELMQRLLVETLGFDSQDVHVMTDQQATKSAILAHLDHLASIAREHEVVFIYFGGYAVATGEQHWAVHDTTRENTASIISVRELCARLTSIPPKKIVVNDTLANKALLKEVKGVPSVYVYSMNSPPEITVNDGRGERSHGTLTWCFFKALTENPTHELSPCEILDRIKKEYEQLNQFGDPPFLDGDVTASDRSPLFDADNPARSLTDQFLFSRRENFENLSDELVASIEGQLERQSHPFPGLRKKLARAYLELGKTIEGLHQLKVGDESQVNLDAREFILVATTLLADRQIRQAQEAWAHAEKEIATDHRDSGSEATDGWQSNSVGSLRRLVLEGLPRRRALLVGINEYLSGEIVRPRGAVNDVEALAAVLTEKWAFLPEDITTLTDTRATRETILREFEVLVDHARHDHCVFAFSGVGSMDVQSRPTILAVDSRLPDIFDIDLSELSRMAKDSRDQLVVILDAGWSRSSISESEAGYRFAPEDSRERSTKRDLPPPETEDVPRIVGAEYVVGKLTFYNSSIRLIETWIREADEVDQSPFRKTSSLVRCSYGRVSRLLAESLSRLSHKSETAQDLVDQAASVWSSDNPTSPIPFYLAANPSSDPFRKPIFGDTPLETILGALNRLELSPIEELIPRLKRLVEKQNWPENYLNLGIACSALMRTDDAIRAFEETIDHKESTKELIAEARYHLGRVLYEFKGDDELDRAIYELKTASSQDPKLAGAFFFLGRALRDAARRVLPELSAKAFQAYLDAGAPLGHEEKVRGWMNINPSR